VKKYCDFCAARKGWPYSIVRVTAKCEVCNTEDLCNNVATWLLKEKTYDVHGG
jgi:hypothetical protein